MAFPSPHCESNSEANDEADGKRDYDDPKGKAPVKRVRFSTLPSRRHAPESPGLYAQMMFRMDLHGKGRPTQLHIPEDPQLGGKWASTLCPMNAVTALRQGGIGLNREGSQSQSSQAEGSQS